MSINITDLVKTQSDNNAAMVEKLPKVYEAGRLNPMDSVKKEVSGENIRVSDVSNVEHNVKCVVESNNLFDFSKINGLNTGEYGTTSNWGYDMKIDSDGNDILVTSSTGKFFYVMFAGLEFKTGQTYTVSLAEDPPHDNGNWGWYCRYIDNEYYDNTNANGSGKINFTFTPIKEVKYIGFRISTGFEYDNPVRLVKPQLELGSTVTAYTPYVSDFSSVNVSRYGKNLFEFKQGVVANGSIVEGLDNGAICQGVVYDNTQHNSWANGWYTFADEATVTLKAGDVVTISCDYTVLELAEGRSMDNFNRYSNKKVNIHLYHSSGKNNLTGTAQNQPAILGEPTRLYITYTVKADGEHYPIFTLNSNKVKVENIQIEIGSTATPYEPFKEPTTYQSTADGIVNGITSIAPNMTVLTDTEGVIINCEYYNYINLLSKEKYKEGHAEGYEAGQNKGYEDGRQAGYNDGFSDGYRHGENIGRGEGIAEGYNDGYTFGYQEGKQAEYDAFWDMFQDYGNRKSYSYAFYGDTNTTNIWNDNNFKPKYDIIIGSSQYASDSIFQYCAITDLKSILENQGVVLDFSKTARLNGTFDRSRITSIPPIDLSACKSLQRTFQSAPIVTIELNNLREDCTFTSVFASEKSLKNLKITGTIGQNGFDVTNATKLTVASMNNVIACLKDYSQDTSGIKYTITFGGTNLKKLSDEEKAVATQKGWTLA